MLALQVSYPHRRRAVIGQWPPPPIFAVFVVLGALATAGALLGVFADPPHAAAIYATGLTADFFTVVFGYMIALDMIMRLPLEGPEK